MASLFKKIKTPDEPLIVSCFRLFLLLFSPGAWRYFIKKIKEKKAVSKSKSIPYHQAYLNQYRPHDLLADFNATRWQTKPTFLLLITATEGTTPHHCQQTLDSLNSQLYRDFEVAFVAPTSFAPPAGIPSLTPEQLNPYLQQTQCEYLFFVPAGCIVANFALFYMARHIIHHPTQLLYTNENILSNGIYTQPVYKPAFSPDRLLCHNYIGDAYIIKTTTLLQLGGIDLTLGNGYTYDVLLRAAENHIPFTHLKDPAISYTEHHNTPDNKYQLNAIKKRKLSATLTPAPHNKQWAILNPQGNFTATVSIIIPSKNKTDLLKTTIDSIFSKTTYQYFEIIVLDNNSTEASFFSLIEHYEATHPHQFRCVKAAFPFNFSRLMNLGVEQATGEYICLLNNDMEVITPRWIENMLLYAMQSHTGAVGIKLLYPNNTLQHGGIAITPTGETYHIDAHKSANEAGYNGSQTIATNLIAVTAACLMVSKQKYQQVHGMDETLAIEYNDIDFCIKLYKAGYYNVYLPYITMYHHESATRGHPLRNLKAWQQHEKEHAYFLGKVKGFLGEDPYCYC